MTPGNVYYFNLTCELAVANGSFSYQAPLLLRQMERDLSILPFVFCTSDDFVLTENRPADRFLQQLENAGFDLPQFCSLPELEAMPEGSFQAILPWGWSPAAHFYLKNIKVKCSAEFKNSPVFHWNEEHKKLYERSVSLDFLHKILGQSACNWMIHRDFTGQKVFNTDKLEILLKKHGRLVVKAPLSSSGRGIQMIRKPELDNARKQWISGVLKQQKYLVAEPFLEKITDFSFQFRIQSATEIDYLGISFFETNSNGQYQHSFIRPEIKQVYSKSGWHDLDEKINETAEILQNALLNSIYSANYRGFIGIDAMIFNYRDQSLIHPCVEVNCRMNMGIVAKKLENKIHRESNGKFSIFYDPERQFQAIPHRPTATERLIFKDEKLFSGTFLLTEWEQHARFGAYISVGEPK